MWLSIRSKDVMELPEEDADLSALHQFLRSVVKAGGMDVTPLEEIVERVLDEDALRAAPIRFGLVTVEQRGLKARELTLDEIPAGKVKDYLMASAACFPALRARDIDGVKFLDGGYSDNMPTGLAKRMGAEELVCVALEGVGIPRPNLTGLPTIMVRSYWELGDILHFDPDTARRNIDMTVVLYNNSIYGMTGGQYSPLTPTGSKATTAPYATIEQDFNVAELVKAAGATFVARGTTFHAQILADLIAKGIEHKGFSLIEAVTACPISYGRQNKMGGPADMMKWQRDHAVPLAAWDKMTEEQKAGKFPIGVLYQVEGRQEYTAAYDELIARAQGGK